MPAYVPPHLRGKTQEAPRAQGGASAPAAAAAAQQRPQQPTQRTFQSRWQAPAGDRHPQAPVGGRQAPAGDWHPLEEPGPAAAAAREQRQARQVQLGQPSSASLPAEHLPSAALAALSQAEPVRPTADLTSAVAALVASDPRVGFPETEPGVAKNPHGWFFPPHRVVMANIMSSETKCVLELGSWLGKSTRFIAERAPNAYIFAVDLWSNEHIRSDPHYTENSGESAFMAHKAARARQIEENLKIIDTAPIYDVFLKNMWEKRPAALPGGVGGGSVGGVVPLKMSCQDGCDFNRNNPDFPFKVLIC